MKLVVSFRASMAAAIISQKNAMVEMIVEMAQMKDIVSFDFYYIKLFDNDFFVC